MLQVWQGSCFAVAVVRESRCSSNLTPSLGTPIYCDCGPKKTKKKKGEGGYFEQEYKLSL